MYALSVLIKPASGICNLNCKYCFYRDEMKNRKISSFGIMNNDTMYNLISKTIRLKGLKTITYAFQGGEPLCAGINYFKSFVDTLNSLNENKVQVIYSIQTNGTLLTDELAKFFKENNFLVGISLDGIKSTHDKYRVIDENSPTFDLVMSKIELLKKYDVPFNILTVISKDITTNIDNIYKFYKNNNFIYQQFIPLINPINDNKIYNYSLTNHNYELFLNKLFKLYYNDIKNSKFVYNRFFENLISILFNQSPENCAMCGHCSIQYVIESNGNVYPCDFYSMDEYIIGNININSIDEIDKKRIEINFLNNQINTKCLKCKYYKLCRNGCKRDRINNKNTYCSAYYNFFEHNIDKLIELKTLIEEGKIKF